MENDRSRLRLRIDAQRRAETTEEWLADEAVITDALDRLVDAGCNRDEEREAAERWADQLASEVGA